MTGDKDSWNWLTMPLVRLRLAAGQSVSVDLPQLYSLLMTDGVTAFPALRPHQKQPLHAFLVQVGALALIAAQRNSPPERADEWGALLRRLTPGFADDEPWSLVVEDLSKPALLQPPVPEGTLDALKDSEVTPDALDMLVTSKNHDLKGKRMAHAEPDEWLFALITLQTMQGYSGSGNYGISRMNTGSTSRPSVGLAPIGGFGARVRRDMTRLLDLRATVLNDHNYYLSAGGLCLAWLTPWDGIETIKPNKLDPYYVEVCRRVRIINMNGVIIARRATTKKKRIEFPEGYNGVTGDPWTPLNRDDGRVRTLVVGPSGFDYQLVARLLDEGRFLPAPLQAAALSDGPNALRLALSVTARNETQTEGYHERTIFVPAKAVRFFGAGAGNTLAHLARERVEQAGTLRDRVLKPALLSMFQNQPEKIDYKHVASNKKASNFLTALDREVDRTFFDDLFVELTEGDYDARDQIRRDWLLRLKGCAERQLATAEAGSPISHVRRYMSRAAAESRLQGMFFSAFEANFPKTGDSAS